MGFRLLRLHGHEVSPDAFRHFEKGGEFFCFAGQSNQAITGIFNLYRASQVLFPGESILEEAKAFASKFLREKQATNQLLDKWIITKDLPGEVDYALDFPWYASLPRIEARFYIEQYGGDDDVWIGKTLMPYVNNNEYLELAEADFNNCQALHQLEWTAIQKWYSEYNLGEFGVGRRGLLQAYFVAMASMFEPERASERLTWARAAVLLEAVKSFMEMDTTTVDQRREFVNDFNNTIHSCSSTFDIHHNSGIGLWVTRKPSEWKTTGKKLLEALVTTLNSIAMESLVIHRLDVRHHLLCTWNTWLLLWCPDGAVEKEQQRVESTNGRGVQVPGKRRGEEGEGELLVRTINLCAGRPISEEHSSHPHYQRLLHLTNSICHHLRLLLNSKGHKKKNSLGTGQIDPLMQELVQLVLRKSDGIDPDVKKTFLTVAKSFYYAAHCNPSTINHHIAKVLFQSVA
ncbi:(-)-kolavenyl diphosphate synthase TPS28, chloroplastic-like isoform X2 [Macadamia integrifolia]|uniref:(-)-kolavenyl diphosphate synthase TPS28, chloroplastic-like isoform X2 n=1 Tax=Macadamia integrifolia TaxID=60698 RepID=UPI001C4FA45F|nr:(-)-kolavenyl diphosphate synthase TPS28, chloroplastic-like isoform X2 [Macadamia integrifolia]